MGDWQKAFERSSMTRAVICFLSIASSTLFVSWIFKVSVECALVGRKAFVVYEVDIGLIQNNFLTFWMQQLEETMVCYWLLIQDCRL